MERFEILARGTGKDAILMVTLNLLPGGGALLRTRIRVYGGIPESRVGESRTSSGRGS
jgi:hypothetical protein